MLVLKGGTAINLCLIKLPRLSVDIDFDFELDCDKEEMYEHRKQIKEIIVSYMTDEGYVLSERSRFVHSLDSFVFGYETLSKSRDILKIEINYSNRCHIQNVVDSQLLNIFGRTVNIKRLADEELIGSKINALIIRTTARDVYDTYNLIKNDLIVNKNLIKKIALFYISIGHIKPIVFNSIFNEAIDNITTLNFYKVRSTLLPVLHKGEKVDIKDISDYVCSFLKQMFILTNKEYEYINRFNLKEYKPYLLFDGFKVNDMSRHPMALWKVNM